MLYAKEDVYEYDGEVRRLIAAKGQPVPPVFEHLVVGNPNVQGEPTTGILDGAAPVGVVPEINSDAGGLPAEPPQATGIQVEAPVAPAVDPHAPTDTDEVEPAPGAKVGTDGEVVQEPIKAEHGEKTTAQGRPKKAK